MSAEHYRVRAPACITCGDVAVPMRVLNVDASAALAVCDDADGRNETVELGLVENVAPGEVLLVHAGAALQREPAGSYPRAGGQA
ncbi:MAG: HypC/HybG/HupF family hydrogenase formation chaperone [Solirubrobacteraceae bacterium]